MTASKDEKMPKLHVEVSPKQKEVATQLVGLYGMRSSLTSFMKPIFLCLTQFTSELTS
jgi:hypothetical protein